MVTRTKPVRRGVLNTPRVPEQYPEQVLWLIRDCALLIAEDRPNTKVISCRSSKKQQFEV